MDQSQVFEMLQQNKNERGIANWNTLKNTGGLTSFGIGLTVQRKLAKQIGKNRALAQQLWQSNCYDAKVIGLLIDDPKQITTEQAEQQVEQLNGGMLTHVFSSCDATLAKSPIGFDVAKRWLESDDPIRRSCAYGLVYEFSKKKSKKYTDAFFEDVIEGIKTTFEKADKKLLLAMGGALLGIGKRSASLNQQALEVVRSVGPIDFNEEGQNCDPFDVEKHLVNPSLQKKLGIENEDD